MPDVANCGVNVPSPDMLTPQRSVRLLGPAVGTSSGNLSSPVITWCKRRHRQRRVTAAPDTTPADATEH